MSLSLSGDELRRIAEVLEHRFTYATLKAFLFFEFNQSIETISLGGNLAEIVVDLLQAAQKGALEGLVEKLAAKFPDEPDLVFFANREEEAKASAQIYSWYPVETDHFGACFLRRRLSFVDRERLRRDLSDLCEEAGAKVLFISGPEGCGKSYSYRFIDYVCKQKLGLEPVLVDLNKWPANSCRPIDLAQSVSRQLGWGEPEFDKNAQEWRQKQDLFDWLTGKIKHQPGPVWLALDGYGQALLPAETEQLIEDLADAADVSLSNRMRLVLTGHSGANPPVNILNLANHVQVSPLDADDYKDFFERLIKRRGDTADPDVIDEAVKKVERKINQDPLNPMPPHLAVSKVVEEWFGV